MTDEQGRTVKYEAARRALAEAKRIDEVKDMRDKAVAMQHYAQQAKDRELIDHATEIRMRAEIAGELLAEMKKRGERQKAGDNQHRGSSGARLPTAAPTLADLGVSKTRSSQWQKLAALSPEEQEAKIEKAKSKAQAAIDPQPRKREDYGYGKAPKLTTPQSDCIATVIRLVSERARKINPAEIEELFYKITARLTHLHKVLGEKYGHHTKRQSA